jgi:hypothetical protein
VSRQQTRRLQPLGQVGICHLRSILGTFRSSPSLSQRAFVKQA